MSEERAVISASLDGARQVVAEAHKIAGAMKAAEKDAQATAKAADRVGDSASGVRGLGTEVDALRSKVSPQALLGGVIGGFVASGLSQVMSMVSAAADKAQSFGDTTSRTARRAGLDLGALRSTVTKNEIATLQGADAQLDYVNALQKTTYNGKGAQASLRSVGMAALASGRDLQEMVPVTAALQDIGIKSDVGDQLARLGDLAQRLKTIGGPTALQDTLAALRPALQQVGVEGARAQGELLGFVAVLGQGRKAGQAAQVASGAIGFMKSNAVQIEYSLHQAGLLKKGQHVLNAQGNVADPLETVKALQALADRKYGKGDSQGKYNAVIGQYGPDLGAAMLERNLVPKAKEAVAPTYGGSVITLTPGGEYDDVKRVAPTQAELEAEAFKRTREGRRESRDAVVNQVQRSFGETALGFRDAAGEVVSQGVESPQLRAPGGGGVVTLNPADRSALAKDIGEATVKAFRDAPQGLIQLQPGRDPNAARGNR